MIPLHVTIYVFRMSCELGTPSRTSCIFSGPSAAQAARELAERGRQVPPNRLLHDFGLPGWMVGRWWIIFLSTKGHYGSTTVGHYGPSTFHSMISALLVERLLSSTASAASV